MTALDVSQFKEPLLLEPNNFTDQMWGGDWIPRFKGLDLKGPVGESWEFSARTQRPSLVRMKNGESLPVTELLKHFPRELLGTRVASRYGAASPLLIKLIDARDDLSVQVHPSDNDVAGEAEDSGKSEAWYILGTASGDQNGFIYIGFDKEKALGYPDSETFEEAFFVALDQVNAYGPSTDPAVRAKAERLLLSFLNKIHVQAGEVYELRPGTVHAIGRGVRVYEVQQSSDITYRVWDWNRPDAKKLEQGKMEFRELHLKQARRVLNFHAVPPEHYRLTPFHVETVGENVQEEILIVDHGKKFAMHRLSFHQPNASLEFSLNEQFQVLTVIQGNVEVSGKIVSQGHSILLPGLLEKVKLRADKAAAQVLRSYVPI